MANEPLLEAREVTKTFFRARRDSAGTFNAVDHVSLALAAGELVELTGRSGGGKSTLLTMMAGLLTPSEGSVLLGGRDLYALPDAELSRLRNERVGVIPQGHTPLGSLSVLDNVCLPWTLYRPAGEITARAQALLDRLGIGDLALAMPSELSGGELRRMAVARALACDPSVILADEPTGDLDDENTAIVLDTLREAADAGKAVLLVTHEAAAAAYATRRLRLDVGKLVDA